MPFSFSPGDLVFARGREWVHNFEQSRDDASRSAERVPGTFKHQPRLGVLLLFRIAEHLFAEVRDPSVYVPICLNPSFLRIDDLGRERLNAVSQVPPARAC